MKKLMMVLLFGMNVLGVSSSWAQRMAVRTNLLYDATTTLNLGVERTFGRRYSLDLSVNYNPWTFSDNRKWKHLLVQPEFRYWCCDRLNGHFVAAHIHGGVFNFGNLKTSLHYLGTDFRKVRNTRYEGWMVGLGVAYGYSWILSRHWNFEVEVGMGYSFVDYDQFKCPKCSEKVRKGTHHYFGPTKMAINLVYVF